MKLSHVDDQNRPHMVNVGHKDITERVARAQAVVSLPDSVQSGEIKSSKGPVFQTAILAGIMGAKKTSDLIPLCHPIGLDDCALNIELRDGKDIVIECTARTHHKTGVEMEALTGATIAALTVYDMLKALSHDIIIRNIRLMEKRGGKSDFTRD